MFVKIDSGIIRFFEWIAHGFQRLTGKDNFWLGWLVFWIRVGLSLICVLIDKKLTKSQAIGETIMIVFTYMLLQITTKFILSRTMFRSSTSRLSIRNPLEYMPMGRLLRAINILFIIDHVLECAIGTSNWKFLVQSCLTATMWYFFSCTPLPPGESRLSKLFGRMKSYFQGKPALAGARANLQCL